jgi:tight adherence protein B
MKPLGQYHFIRKMTDQEGVNETLLVILLFLCLFLLFCFLFLVDVEQDATGIKGWFRRLTLPTASAGAAFLLGLSICRTPLAGVIWAVGGWLVPGWAINFAAERKKAVIRGDTKNFITAAAGLYAAGQVTPEVIRTAMSRFPEPLLGEFQVMLGRHNTDRKASFPSMFDSLAAKYELPEFKALAAIVAASERAGGPKAAAEGLKQLAVALRARDRRQQERRRSTLEPLIAAGVVILLTSLGFLIDVTLLAHYYFSHPAGRIVLSGASLLILAMVLLVLHAVNPKDLMG